MVPGAEYFKGILSRIRDKAPCSIIIKDKLLSDSSFVDGFLSAVGSILVQSKILPVRVNCAEDEDSLSIWKSIASAVQEQMAKVFDGSELTEEYFSIISDTDDTDDVQSYLISILGELSVEKHWTVLLIMENFDHAIDIMPEYDAMKIREMTETLAVMTITKTSLEELCEQKYDNVYFANQFVDPSILE